MPIPTSPAFWTLLNSSHLVSGSVSLVESANEAWDENKKFANATAMDTPTNSATVDDDGGTGFSILLRGIHAPQMWFKLPPLPSPGEAGDRLQCGLDRGIVPRFGVGVLACREATSNPTRIGAGIGAMVFL